MGSFIPTLCLLLLCSHLLARNIAEAGAPIQSISDVCIVCTSIRPYNPQCNSLSAKRCLTAVRTYMSNLVDLSYPVCSCITSVTQLLLESCPAAPFAVSYLQSCDSSCGYGVTCPYQSIFHVILNSKKTTPPPPASLPSVSSYASMYFLPRVVKGLPLAAASLCVRLTLSPAMPNVTYAAIYKAQNGNRNGGTPLLTLFNGASRNRAVTSVIPCVPITRSVWKTLSLSPGGFFLRVASSLKYNPATTLSGNLVSDLHIYSDSSFRTATRLFMDGRPSAKGFQFSFSGPGNVSTMLSSSIMLPISAIFSQNLITLFSPQGPPAQAQGTVGSTADVNSQMLSSLSSVILRIQESAASTSMSPMSDKVLLSCVMRTANVIPFSRATGSAVFAATVGSSALCFRITYLKLNDQPVAVNIYKGANKVVGDIVIPLADASSPSFTNGCVPVDDMLLADLIAEPALYYVQLYSVVRPFGALRCNLSKYKVV